MNLTWGDYIAFGCIATLFIIALVIRHELRDEEAKRLTEDPTENDLTDDDKEE
jgi:hypothetical protein